jgi:hypothetical protein
MAVPAGPLMRRLWPRRISPQRQRPAGGLRDVDLVGALASSLGLRLEVHEAGLDQLQTPPACASRSPIPSCSLPIWSRRWPSPWEGRNVC